MERLVQVFVTLALAATALAAPGPMFGSLFQRPGGRPSFSTSISTSSSESSSKPSSFQFQPPRFSTSLSTSSSSSEPSSEPSSLQFQPPRFSTSTSTSSSESEPSSFQFQPPRFSTSTSTSSSESEPSLFQFQPPWFSTSSSVSEPSSEPSSFQFQPPSFPTGFPTSSSSSDISSEPSSEPSSLQFQPPWFSTTSSTSSSSSESSSEPTSVSHMPIQSSSSSSPSVFELREDTPKTIFKSKPSPSDSRCTPGDRQCHASLDYILFCNDNNQWLSYSGCQDGTFCHRLHMICVPEVRDPTAVSTPAHIRRVRDTDPPQCQEGDRRCSLLFNRVDRCNDDHDWVTYHNCRKSELCDEGTLECLPRISFGSNGSMPHGHITSNRTGAVLK